MTSLSNRVYTGFTPTQIANCKLWLDGYDQNSFIFAGNLISKWNDKSGNGYHGTSITGSPVYIAESINGLNAVSLNGSSAITGTSASAMNSGTTLTCFAVGIMSNTVVPYGRMVSVLGVGPEDQNQDSANLIGTAAGAQAVFSYRNYAPLGQANVTYGTPFQACTLFDGSIQTMYVNGTAGTSASTTGNFGYTSYTIGEGSSSFWRGFVGEVIIYNSALSSTDRRIVEGYLAQKWKLTSYLPVGHPGLTSNIFNIALYLPKVPIEALPYSATFSPLQIPGSALWLDASTSNSITFGSGTNVASWLDKSGNGRHATQVTASNQPHWTDGSTNGIFFNGALGECLNLPSLTFTSISVFMVAQATTYSSGAVFLSLTAGTGIYLRPGYGFSPGPTYDSYAIDYGSYNYRYVPNSAVTDTTRHLWAFTLPSSGVGTFTWDGTTGNSAAGFTFSQIATTFPNPSIGAYGQNPTNSPFTGYIHEIIIYSTNLTTTQRQTIESYLAEKWKLTQSLPSNHPYFTTPAGAPPLVASLVGIPARPFLQYLPFYPVTLGGTITTFGGRRFHAFTTVGTNNFILGADNASKVIEYFVLAGGGGGAGSGGGGGAGGLVNSTITSLISGVYTVTVGAGGARGGNNSNGSTGSPSSVSWGVTALGGGYGAKGSETGGNGGCGGGGGYSSGGTTGSPGGGTGSQGGNGTGGRIVESSVQSGGGGGTGGNAIVPSPYGTGATGGTGVSYYNFGFLGGGGGGARTTLAYGFAGPGGAGGGGNGGAGPGGNGVDGKGGGGGGGDDASTGGNGGSGIVIISYAL